MMTFIENMGHVHNKNTVTDIVNKLKKDWVESATADEDFEFFLDEFQSVEVLNCLSKTALNNLNYRAPDTYAPEKLAKLCNYKNAINGILKNRDAKKLSQSRNQVTIINNMYRKDVAEIKQHPRPKFLIIILLRISSRGGKFDYIKGYHRDIYEYLGIPTS